MDFLQSLWGNFLAMAQIFVLGVAGFYVLRRGILGECCLRTVSNLVIEVTLPCFMFTNIIENFDTVRGEHWYLFPLVALLMFALGALIAGGWLAVDRGVKARGEFLSLVTFQNGGFLPIIVIGTMLPDEIAGKIYVYIFLFTMLFAAVIISSSRKLFAGEGGVIPDAKSFFNAASSATIAAVIISLLGFESAVPQVIFRPLKLLGEATIPLSMIVVGGIMVVNFKRGEKFKTRFVLKTAFLKLLVLPVIVFGILLAIRQAPGGPFLSPEVEFLLMLESMMPPAITLPLLAGKHGGDYILAGQALFGVTLLSIFTVPLLLALFNVVPG